MVSVKICGLRRAQDAISAEEAGASYGGVILASGSPRTVSPRQAAEIFAGVGLARCGVVVNETIEGIRRLVDELGLSVVQLHGDEPPELAAAVREQTGAETWKAIRVRSGFDVVDALASYGSVADGLFLDGWSASARGGTGQTFPWEEVAAHRASLGGLRLIAAGGLNPDNVARVIEVLAPDVVDVSSGVEATPGVKDARLIRAFSAAAKGAAH
jgi:phosphoribosylanthranilate isomerase